MINNCLKLAPYDSSPTRGRGGMVAKDLRAKQTEVEKELWKISGAKKIPGLHFRMWNQAG